jgi:hypothetical protein
MFKNLIKKLRNNKPVKLYRSGWTGQNEAMNSVVRVDELTTISDRITFNPSSYAVIEQTNSNVLKEDKRIEKLPVEVYKEIFTTTPIVDCVSLDKKIELVEKRLRVLKEVGADAHISNEKEALGFLKARTKFKKYVHLFQWETTTDELIENLLKTYKLAKVSLAQYQRNIPAEAIDELEKFSDAYEKCRDDMPILWLIIDDKKDDKGNSKERRKDPILLASSPFGAWWYVLGAWDQEVEVIDDLIYHKK